MLGRLLGTLVVMVVLVAAALFLLGWWDVERRGTGDANGAVGTTGIDTERAREVGADIGEKTAAAAEQARRGITDAGITAKIKAKMTLDDRVKALDLDVDTRDLTVTVTGTVDTSTQKERALELARETDGVKQVIDRVQVKP